jgi:hypothetical protein
MVGVPLNNKMNSHRINHALSLGKAVVSEVIISLIIKIVIYNS